jgi:hypothetical protein
VTRALNAAFVYYYAKARQCLSFTAWQIPLFFSLVSLVLLAKAGRVCMAVCFAPGKVQWCACAVSGQQNTLMFVSLQPALF